MPARTKFLTAVRRKSCGMRPGQPALRQANFRALLKDVITFGCFLCRRARRPPRGKRRTGKCVSRSRRPRGKTAAMPFHTLCRTAAAMLLLVFVAATTPTTKDNPFKRRQTPPPIVGRWDVTAPTPRASTRHGSKSNSPATARWSGRYVAKTGSARPIARVDFDDATGTFRFAVPPQWERRLDDVVLEGKLEGDVIRGETSDVKGKPVSFEARRAPLLKRDAAVTVVRADRAVQRPRPRRLEGRAGRRRTTAGSSATTCWSTTSRATTCSPSKPFTDFKLARRVPLPEEEQQRHLPARAVRSADRGHARPGARQPQVRRRVRLPRAERQRRETRRRVADDGDHPRRAAR